MIQAEFARASAGMDPARAAQVLDTLCPELDVASQGDIVEQARTNLAEAVRLFLEAADQAEIHPRFRPPLPRVLFEQPPVSCPRVHGRSWEVLQWLIRQM